jgi:hypothetical protein
MPDRIFAGLTARQIAVLGGHALVLWATYAALAGRVPIAFIGVVATPIAVLGAAWAWGRPEGTTFEKLAVSAARQLLSARRRVAAPEGIPTVPSWAGTARNIAAIDAPSAEPIAGGIVDLAGAGSVIACRASSLNFRLRSEREQRALVDGFGRVLNALDSPVQFLIRSERADLRAMIESLETRAPSLPHPALETAAREHAEFLRGLASRRDVLSRHVFVCVRDPGQATDEQTRARLSHRTDEAATLLRGVGIKLTPLDADEVSETLCRAANPEAPAAPRLSALSREIVEGAR